MKAILRLLERQSKNRMTVVCLLALLSIGALDYATGVEISFSIFYLLPIGLATWFAGRIRGLALSLAGSAIWLTADLLWPAQFSHHLIVYWNAAVRFGVYVIMVQLLVSVKAWNERLETKVEERTRALALEAENRRRLIEGLQEALARVRQLSGLLPICASCKRIRDGQDSWNQIEEYIRQHSEADFTHGICPECSARLYPGIQTRPSETRER